MRRTLDPAAFIPIDMPGATGTFPLDINSGGAIVGRYSLGGRVHGFQRSAAGVLMTIDYPGSIFTVAAGINNDGDIVGMYAVPASPNARHGYLLRNGAFTSFDPPGSTFTNALGIDARGVIVGRFCTLAVCRVAGSGDFHGFVFERGHFSTIDFPGSRETNLWKIGRPGLIIGSYGSLDATSHLLVLRRDDFTSIDLPGALPISQDNGGINQNGDIVGLYCDAAPCNIVATGTHGYLFSGGRLTAIDIPGAFATSAIGINARQDIVGGYYDASARIHGYLLQGTR